MCLICPLKLPSRKRDVVLSDSADYRIQRQDFRSKALPFMTSPNKINVVEGIRGLACFMVVLSHLSLTFFPYLHLGGLSENSGFPIQKLFYESPFAFIYSGTAAIFIFFVLSGYILSYVALGKSYYKGKFVKMSLKRYPRLAIPTLVSCLLAFTLFSLFNLDTSQLSEWITKYGNFNYSLIGAIFSGTIESFFGKSSHIY